ncbi:glycosyltransferase [Candidatus Falkowbacteria bacterium]|jgi:glycosyltransferase involved in cell wall biosynthesis|nr:glycosyltransferase [Candidatus Falkowbacteria bacterium]MBT4433120.1 glycosyltransferase [Candidatus Falkowbacteria bacterium]
MKIALVHDMLTQYGGAEKVFKALTEMFPEAPIFTLVYDEAKMGKIFPKNRINTSFLQKIPLAEEKYEWFLPLMPMATEKYKLDGFDLVISSASAFAKGIITPKETKHICYCHTPARYLWIDSEGYINGLNYNKFIKKLISFVLPRLKSWDKKSNDRVDEFIANSKNVQKRIKKYYNRDSLIVYPPVETHKFYTSKNKENYFLAGGRLVSYKKFDLIIESFNKTKLPLKIFGTGPDLKKLKSLANKNIEFLGFVNEKEKPRLYSKALAYIYPQKEDFGITLVESLASGTPIIAYRAGGAIETLPEGVGGEFFDIQTAEELTEKIKNFDPIKYNQEKMKQHAEKFKVEIFKKEISRFIA